MSDLPANIDLQWLGQAILAMRADIAEIKVELTAKPSRGEIHEVRDELIASMRSELSRLNDGDMVSLAVVNRMDGTLISVLAEMRALRTRFDGIARRLETLERQS
jgi:uncharacterized protein involved in exopolysaccharide biosynthesis